MHASISLQQLYTKTCTQLDCKANSVLLKQLPATAEDNASLQHLDLSLNFVGPIGAKAAIAVAQCAVGLQSLNLRDNQVTNDVVEFLCESLRDHPTLRVLDLAKNPISHPGGKLLAQFVLLNRRVMALDLKGAMLNPSLLKKIDHRLQDNIKYWESLAAPPAEEVAVVKTTQETSASPLPPVDTSSSVLQDEKKKREKPLLRGEALNLVFEATSDKQWKEFSEGLLVVKNTVEKRKAGEY